MAKYGSKRVQIGVGRGDLFDDVGFLAGLSRKLEVAMVEVPSRGLDSTYGTRPNC